MIWLRAGERTGLLSLPQHTNVAQKALVTARIERVTKGWDASFPQQASLVPRSEPGVLFTVGYVRVVLGVTCVLFWGVRVCRFGVRVCCFGLSRLLSSPNK